METNNLNYFKQKIYEIARVPKSRLEKNNKTFIIRVGNFRFRFLYDPCLLVDGWVNISFHFSYTLRHALNFHMAVRKKWPFIKIGFKNIYPKLYRGGGF